MYKVNTILRELEDLLGRNIATNRITDITDQLLEEDCLDEDLVKLRLLKNDVIVVNDKLTKPAQKSEFNGFDFTLIDYNWNKDMYQDIPILRLFCNYTYIPLCGIAHRKNGVTGPLRTFTTALTY